jgi:hypothetical protein
MAPMLNVVTSVTDNGPMERPLYAQLADTQHLLLSSSPSRLVQVPRAPAHRNKDLSSTVGACLVRPRLQWGFSQISVPYKSQRLRIGEMILAHFLFMVQSSGDTERA